MLRSDNGMEKRIPIKNIFYMLCYAWDILEQKDIVEINSIASIEIQDLFAMVLANGVNYLIRKGFHRRYISHAEDSSMLRGKININESVKRRTWLRGKMHCHYDDLSFNILQNQIIKTTINNLLLCEGLDKKLKARLLNYYRYLTPVETIRLNKGIFGKVQINRNNRSYLFLLAVCEIVYENLLVADNSGRMCFRDFTRDEKKMAYVFESFVRNFYKRELVNGRVYREDIRWLVDEGTKNEYLPLMKTDISIDVDNRKIIIDTKYKRNTFTYHHGSKKLHPGNLYQVFAYLKNVKAKGDRDRRYEGILLYPWVGEDLDLDYILQGERIKVKTINLNMDWQLIHNRLLEIVAG